MIISRMKRALNVKQKTFLLVSKVHPFRHTKQTSKNVANTPLERGKNCFIPWKPTKALAHTQNYNYDCFTIAFSLIKLNLIPQNRHLLNSLIKCLTGLFKLLLCMIPTHNAFFYFFGYFFTPKIFELHKFAKICPFFFTPHAWPAFLEYGLVYIIW